MHRGGRMAMAAIAVVLLAGGAGAWWLTRPPASGRSEADAAVSNASARVPKAPVAVPALPPVPTPPIATGPLAETVERLRAQGKDGPSADFLARRVDLERKVAGGDAAAAGELGNLLLTCESYFDFGEGDIENLFVEGMARFGKEAMQLPDSVPIDAAVDSAKHEMTRMRDLCAGSQGLELTHDERMSAFDALRRAAQAGDADAMANFANFAFTDFADTREMIAHPERVRERKREARGYLERAIAAGNEEALNVAATAHHEGTFLEKSDVLAYANFYAYARADAKGGAILRAHEADLALYGADLTPAQVTEARQRGDALYAKCCAARPGGSL